METMNRYRVTVKKVTISYAYIYVHTSNEQSAMECAENIAKTHPGSFEDVENGNTDSVLFTEKNKMFVELLEKKRSKWHESKKTS